MRRTCRDVLESVAERLWYRKRGLAFALCLPLLGPWTLVTSILARRRKRLQSLAKPPAIPVIGIGNLAAGGTGKTQVVLMLARQALSNGRRVAVVARGYRASQKEPLVVPPDGYASRFGDEPVLLQRRLSEAPAQGLAPPGKSVGAVIIVSRDRAAGVAMAASRGCDLVLLDDGLQQTRVVPDRQVVVFGAESPLGNGALLPLGPLRDPCDSLRGSDLVWLHGEGSGVGLPRVDVRSRTVAIAAQVWSGRRVFAFAGIARPERFFRTLSEAGATIVGSARFSDHRRFSLRDLEQLCARAASLGAEGLICTEKDGVRLPLGEFSLPIATLETHLEIVEGQAAVDRLLARPG